MYDLFSRQKQTSQFGAAAPELPMSITAGLFLASEFSKEKIVLETSHFGIAHKQASCCKTKMLLLGLRAFLSFSLPFQTVFR